jgi:hypothetical protein
MKSVLFIFSLLLAISVNGQGVYQLNGSTVDLGGGTYQLTQAVNSEFGTIWYKVQHDINTSFNAQGQMNFGADPGGADGIAFVMQTNCLQVGGSGGGLGFSGITGQSFEIEFDTYQNIAGSGDQNNFDPPYDHIAVEKNGYVKHDGTTNALTKPVQMDPVLTNVKTGAWYNFQINYNVLTKELRVFFNGSLRVDTIYDIAANAFPGTQYVYWGFTSSTGGFNNIQQIKLNSTLTTHSINDTTICSGSIPVSLPSLNSLRGTDLALNNPVYASSGGANIVQAVDGNMGSRWESAWGIDPQWIYVDLQSPADIDSVTLDWEGAFATAYQLQTSNDASTWTIVFSTTTNPGGHNKIVFSASNVRYVRMYGTARSLSSYGYSIWEFKVYGQPKYVWSTNNGTNSTISPNVYSSSVVLTPTSTTTYSVVIPDPCVGYTTLTSTVTINCAAPVTLIGFRLQPEGQGTNVEWTTASERNSNYFEVLKSNDGIHFYSIGKVSASGNSSTVHTYNFQDNELNTGIAYYKLATIDIDGSKEESEIESIQSKTTKAFVLSPIFEEETSLIIGGKIPYIQYSIIDMIGREISANKYIQNPSDVLPIGQDLAPACYLLKLNTDTYSETIKICKVK